MKFRNFKSAIHNFAHSFQSIDYTNSGKLAINTLVKLNTLEIDKAVVFDFINEKILPKEVVGKNSLSLLRDYKVWAYEHFIRHKCDFNKLEKLNIKIYSDFSRAIIPQEMVNESEIIISTEVLWKVEGRNEEVLNISSNEVVSSEYLKNGFPELN